MTKNESIFTGPFSCILVFVLPLSEYNFHALTASGRSRQQPAHNLASALFRVNDYFMFGGGHNKWA